MATSDVVSEVVLALIEPYLAGRRASLDAVLSRAGLERRHFDEPLRLIPLNAVARILNAAAEATGDHNFGLGYGEFYAPRGAGVMGQLQLTAPTIRDMIASTAEFASIGIPALRLEFVEEAEISTFTGYLPASLDVHPRQVADFLMATFITRIRRGAGARWTPLATDLAYPKPADTRGLARFYGDHVTFEQPAYRILIDTRMLDTAVEGVPHGPFQMTRTYMERLSRRAPFMETPITAETRSLIIGQLAAEAPVTLEAIAAVMATKRSVRQLQALLEQEQTNFETVLLNIRQTLARSHLRDSDMSMGEIAVRLGFASASVLSRWAVAQFGATPTRLRRQWRDERIAPNRAGGANVSG